MAESELRRRDESRSTQPFGQRCKRLLNLVKVSLQACVADYLCNMFWTGEFVSLAELLLDPIDRTQYFSLVGIAKRHGFFSLRRYGLLSLEDAPFLPLAALVPSNGFAKVFAGLAALALHC
jgi:hypothetical protein